MAKKNNGKLPQDIPVSGRYDVLLDKIGHQSKRERTKDGGWTRVRTGKFVEHWLIDNGKFRGARVSRVLNESEHSERDVRNLRVNVQLDVVREDQEGKRVPDDYNVGKVKIMYHISDFQSPRAESDLLTVLRRKKFTR